MSIVVGSFYAGKERFKEYLPFIRAAKKSVEITNPNAKFMILTDVATSPLFDDEEDLELFIVGQAYDMPLMLKIIDTQRIFIRETEADLIVLADVDCFANKSIEDAIPQDVGMAITHKGPKFHYRINNMAYVRDRELGIWFLKRAFGILKAWPEEKHHWWGDQEAWQSALGVPISGLGYWAVVERLKDEILLARPENRAVYLYPCQTHNCPMPDDGNIRPAQRDAYFVHFKGPRKEHIQKWMAERFGNE